MLLEFEKALLVTELFHTLWEYTKSPAHTPHEWDRKYLQRAFAFADNGFVHSGIEPIKWVNSKKN